MKTPRTVVIRGGQPVELYDDDPDSKASLKEIQDRYTHMAAPAAPAGVASGAQRFWGSPEGKAAQSLAYAKGGPVIKAGYKHSDPNHLQFGQSGDSSLLAKKRQGYADGGKVEFDPNASSRAGSRQYGVDEKGEFWGWKEPYPRQQEVTPSESKDRNRIIPEDVMPDVYKKDRISET